MFLLEVKSLNLSVQWPLNSRKVDELCQRSLNKDRILAHSCLHDIKKRWKLWIVKFFSSKNKISKFLQCQMNQKSDFLLQIRIRFYLTDEFHRVFRWPMNIIWVRANVKQESKLVYLKCINVFDSNVSWLEIGQFLIVEVSIWAKMK